MKRLFLVMAGLLVPLALALSGCGKGAPGPAQAQASSDFAAGAFPPTLSDTDYHRQPWTRDDCLKCHREGVDNAPKVRHVSLPDLAVNAKCRTCHVLIQGQQPPK